MQMMTLNSAGAVTLVLLSVACVARSSVIKVSQLECSQCTNISSALQGITSDSTLSLLSGADHILDRFTMVRNLRNVTLIGNDSSVTVTCSEDIGLAFVNVTNLTVEHVTIQQCGLSKENLQNSINVTAEIVDIFFHVPFHLQVGLLLVDITYANLNHVNVRNTAGIGLLGINIVGNGSFTEVTFSQNVYSGKNCSVTLEPEVLRGDYKNQIGGGAFLLYHDYLDHSSVDVHMTVQRSTFSENSDCSIFGSVARRIQFSETLRMLGYTVGAGGGLSVVLAQREYSVNFTVDSCLFHSNLAPYGGGAHVSLFADIGSSEVVFSNCTFTGNGLINLTDGGGIAVLGNLVRLSGFSSPCCQASEVPRIGTVNVKVDLSNFKSNIAYAGGGIYALFLHSFKDRSGERIHLHYSNCVFENNTASYGSALYIFQHNILTASAYSTPPGVRMEATNIVAKGNTLVDRIRNSASASSGTVDIRFTHFTLSGDSTLEHNSGTALQGRRSPIHLVGRITIQNNIAVYGGAFSLLAFSVLIIHANTTVILQNNRATYRGGAFYVHFNDRPLFVPDDCFLYLDSSDRYYFDQNNSADIRNLDITLIFSGNNALYGNLAYGSALKTCSWGDALRMRHENYTGNFWELLATSKETNDTFRFDRIPAGVDYVTTRSANLNIDGERSFTAVPGKQFHVTLNATDHLNQVVSIPVRSAVFPNNTTPDIDKLPSSVVGDTNYWTLRINKSSNVPLRVFGNQEDLVNVLIFTSESGVDVEIEVYLTNCLPGFYYLAGESACVCMPQLQGNGINCSNTTQEVRVPNAVWVGLLDGSTDKQHLVIEQCILDYCEPGTRVLDKGNFDIQCAKGYNRTGLLCGSCREGYSVVLGTRICRKCTNNAYLALILLFAAAGILLIALVAFLKVSVSEGYLYGPLFFSHNISPYIFILAPRAPYVFVPVAFLNLDLGIETCFYEGMNALAYAGLQFVFPFYIYLLMVVIVVLARYIKFPFHIGFSAGQTFATLLALTYSSIGRTCVDVLLYQAINSVEGDVSSIRWRIDPIVHYFQGWHAFLVIVSILLFLVYLIPLPLILLFPTKAYKIKTMKPLLDAFFNSYEPKFRCWVGIGILTGIVLSVLPVGLRLVPAVFTAAMVLSLFAYVQMQLRPYRGFWRNASNNFLVVNTSVLLTGIVFFNEQCRGLHYNANDIHWNHTLFSAAILSTAYVVFTGVLLYHIFLRLPQSTQKYIKSYIERNKLLGKITYFCTEKSVPTQDNVLIDLHAYREFGNDGFDSEMEFGQTVVEAPNDYEGTANVTPITPPFQ